MSDLVPPSVQIHRSQIKALSHLEVELRGEGVAASGPLDSAAVGLDVDDVADLDALLLHRLVDRRVQLQLLRPLRRLQTCMAVKKGIYLLSHGSTLQDITLDTIRGPLDIVIENRYFLPSCLLKEKSKVLHLVD